MSQCPCDNCQTRKMFAKTFDFHFYGNDCPYDCFEYDMWKQCNEGGKDDGMVLVGNPGDPVPGVRNKDDVR